MSSPIAIFTADWHVRKYDRVWTNHRNLAGDTAFAIRQIIALTGEYNVPNLLLGGDNFEEKVQPSDTMELMRHSLDVLQENDVNVWYVQGQHELADPPCMSALHNWPQHLHGRTVDLDGVRVHGLDYQRPHRVQEALEAVPADADWLLTHQVWKNVMGDDRGYAWSHWLRSTPWILSGDYHDAIDTLFQNADNHDLQFVSPGPVAMQAIDENPHKSVVLLYDDSSWQRLALRTRSFHIAHINTQDDLDRFIAEPLPEPPYDLPDEIATPIVRVVYSTAVPEVRARVVAAHGEHAHLFWKPLVTAVDQQDTDTAERISTVLEGGLPAVIRQHYSEDTTNADIAIRLYEAGDHEAEIARIFDELTGGNTHGTDHDREGALQETGRVGTGGAAAVGRVRRPSL